MISIQESTTKNRPLNWTLFVTKKTINVFPSTIYPFFFFFFFSGSHVSANCVAVPFDTYSIILPYVDQAS